MPLRESYFKQPSVDSSADHFAHIPFAEIPRSTFDRSSAYKTTFDAGLLIPVFLDEVMPGDTFSMSATCFARLATPLKPIMDNIKIETQFFFVPTRLVMDNWQRLMGERDNPDDDPGVYTVPQTSIDINVTTISGTVADYFGIPKNATVPQGVDVNALPFRCYALIYNEWYRDQNLQNSVPVPKGDGPDTWNALMPYRRGKRHDYFTSCLPWPQKGDPVVVPLGDLAPVMGIGLAPGVSFVPGGPVRESGGVDTTYANLIGTNSSFPAIEQDPANPGYPAIYADLAQATAITINDLRSAFMIQQLLERDARGGTRYIELIRSQFGVQSPDARLQRPELLSTSTDHVNINPVAATAPLPDAPQGNLAAFGTAVARGGFTKSFTEHGYIIGIASARADLTYQQGLDRMWTRKTRYDFPWPALANLGEQAVFNKELYLDPASAQNDQVFGYQERYAEYRYKPSRITGLFASNEPQSLDVWHLAQDFASMPSLNASFIEDNPPIDRILAVQDEPHFLADFWFSLRCTRPLPIYGVPGFGVRF